MWVTWGLAGAWQRMQGVLAPRAGMLGSQEAQDLGGLPLCPPRNGRPGLRAAI